jgi:hypothetical protein
MHHTHQIYKQIWAHPLPNGHLLWQSGEGQPHLKPKKQKQELTLWMKVSPCTMRVFHKQINNLNLRMTVLHKKIKIKKHKVRVLCRKIKDPKQKMRVLSKPNVQKLILN